MINAELHNNDCLVVMHQLIENGIKVDAVIADIPYGIHNNKFDEVIPFDKMWDCLTKLVKPKGNIVLFADGLFTYKLALSNTKLFRYELIWKKSKCGSPLTAKYMPLKKHENILVFGKSAAYYEPQMENGKPYKRKYTPNKVNNLRFGIKGVQTDNKGTRHPTTILDFPQKWRRQDQLHPTQKPVEFAGKGKEWAERSYEENVRRDEYKQKLCIENGIKLLYYGDIISNCVYNNINDLIEWIIKRKI